MNNSMQNNTKKSLKEMRENFLIKSELKGKIGEMMLDNLLSKQAEEISEAVEKLKTYTGGSSVNEKDIRINKADALLAIKQVINK